MKTDGEKTFPYVVKALQPLRDAGFLTTWNGTMKSGAVTLIGTGNTPLNQVQGQLLDSPFLFFIHIVYEHCLSE